MGESKSKDTPREAAKVVSGTLRGVSIGTSSVGGAVGPVTTISSTPLVKSGPLLTSGPGLASGGMISTYPTDQDKPDPPVELVQLPPRVPRRVLVGFFDDEDGVEPYWAAYLEPEELDLWLRTADEGKDAVMKLSLKLERKFKQ